jgi:putative tryptophan/tyrosine transport system substrate-binding protein
MRRREFITLLGGATVWLRAAHAQQPERMRRIGVLMTLADDSEGQTRLAAFLQGLAAIGWSDGRNMRIDTRWGAGDADRMRRYAAELIALAPDVILVVGGAAVGPLLQATRTVPIVFTGTPDPVGAGFVASLARPGGNATGFTRSNSASARNGWSCSRRSRRTCRERRSFGMRPYRPGSASWARSNLWRHRSAWS